MLNGAYAEFWTEANRLVAVVKSPSVVKEVQEGEQELRRNPDKEARSPGPP